MLYTVIIINYCINN